MLMNADEEERARVFDLIDSEPDDERDPDAPSWWVGGDAAYRSSMRAASKVGLN